MVLYCGQHYKHQVTVTSLSHNNKVGWMEFNDAFNIIYVIQAVTLLCSWMALPARLFVRPRKPGPCLRPPPAPGPRLCDRPRKPCHWPDCAFTVEMYYKYQNSISINSWGKITEKRKI